MKAAKAGSIAQLSRSVNIEQAKQDLMKLGLITVTPTDIGLTDKGQSVYDDNNLDDAGASDSMGDMSSSDQSSDIQLQSYQPKYQLLKQLLND